MSWLIRAPSAIFADDVVVNTVTAIDAPIACLDIGRRCDHPDVEEVGCEAQRAVVEVRPSGRSATEVVGRVDHRDRVGDEERIADLGLDEHEVAGVDGRTVLDNSAVAVFEKMPTPMEMAMPVFVPVSCDPSARVRVGCSVLDADATCAACDRLARTSTDPEDFTLAPVATVAVTVWMPTRTTIDPVIARLSCPVSAALPGRSPEIRRLERAC